MLTFHARFNRSRSWAPANFWHLSSTWPIRMRNAHWHGTARGIMRMRSPSIPWNILHTVLQSKQCMWRLNLTFQGSHTFLLLPAGKSSDCAFATQRARSWARCTKTFQTRCSQSAAAVSRKALLSSSFLQPISITHRKNTAGFTDLYGTCTANICYRHVSTIVYHTCILHHSTDL